MPDESSFHPPDAELEERARQFAERATNILEGLKKAQGPSASDSTEALLYFLQSQSCYAELNRREAIRRAKRDNEEAEDREGRHFWIELIAELVIIALIGWEIYAGRQQAATLQQTNKNTENTALEIQRAADAVTASLEILRQERAERAKKPRLALYLRKTPIDSASVHLKLTGTSHDMAALDLLLKNGGDAPVSPSRLHALTPEGVLLQNPINTSVVRQVEPEANGFTVQLPLLPAGQKVRVFMQLHVPHGHASFKIPFTVDAMELQSVLRLGSLTVLPPEP